MPTRRILILSPLAIALAFAFLMPGFAKEPKPVVPILGDDYEERQKPGVCWCEKGNASWAYLRSPLKPPQEPSRCGLLRHGGNCAKRARPKGTSGTCWGSGKVDCFWKRHAYSYKIQCSECWSNDECPSCDTLIDGRDAKTQAWLTKRLEREAETLGMKNLVIVRSPHFYVVTNMHKKTKLVTRSGGKRLMTAHEVAHLYAQRCEQAYEDYMHWFGGPISFTKPTAVFVVDTQKEYEAVGARYFGRAGIHMNYAFAFNERISDGVSGNGFVVSAQRENSDTKMHGYCRHQVGHILFSCWQVSNGFEDHCPRWAWCGVAHFLEKLIDPLHRDYATFCYGEANKGGTGPVKKWAKRVRALAEKGPEPIETFFGRNSLSALRYEDHLRAWSFMDLGLREDRDRWLAMLRRLRKAEDETAAFKEELGVTPEVFHQRWTERVLGKRKSIGPERGPDDDVTDPLLRELLKVQESDNADLLAGRLRGLDVIKDVRAAKVVLGFMAHPSDLVRETIHLLLTKTKDATVLEFLTKQGLADGRWVVRAGVARALGALKHAPSRFSMEQLLEDKKWLVRANAAYAIQEIGDRVGRRALQPHLTDKDPRAWISICDAFASFPGRSKEATALIVPRLEHKRWQVRLTACRALRRVGTAEALAPLIKRFREESGRLKRELHAALVGVAGHDAGLTPALWDKWWREQQEAHGGLPPRPTQPKRGEHDDRYGFPDEPEEDMPRHYGRRFFSKSVCFVLDTSGSMNLHMDVPEEAVKRLGDIPASGTRDHIAKQALIHTLTKLDRRTRMRLVFFASDVKLWKDGLVPANEANSLAAVKAVRRKRPDGETNFYGALKAAIGLHKKPTIEPALDVIPDTVFFLTDGRPTRGQITSMPELTSWIVNLNRWAKIELHIIALGELGVDVPQLRALGEAIGGTFTHVPEKG